MAPGVKRSWDQQELPYGSDHDSESNKRFKESHHRERRDDRSESHGRLDRSNRSNGSLRQRDSSRKDHGHHYHSRRDSDYRDDRDYDRHRERDKGRANSKERRRDRGKESDRHREHDRSRRRTRELSRDHSQTNGTNGHLRVSDSTAPSHVSEKEEGEISPFPTHPRRSRSPRSRSPALPSKRSPSPKHPPEPEPEVELTLATSPPPVETILAARRAQRQAILSKYKQSSNGISSTSGMPVNGFASSSSALQPQTSISTPISNITASSQPQNLPFRPKEPQKVADGARSPSGSPEPTHAFSLAKDEDAEAQAHNRAKAESDKSAEGEGQEQILAADYDPNADRLQEEARRARVMNMKQGPEAIDIDLQEAADEDEVEEEDEDEVFDMFAIDTVPKKKKVKRTKSSKPVAPALVTMTRDAAADPEGYYQVILGEQLDGSRYQVYSSLGKGMFSNVVRARVLNAEVGEAGKEVAIKIVRAQETMYKAGLKEIQILNKLKQADPDDKRHVIRLERTFEHRGHLCLVFESMSLNLREIVKRFGKDVGLNIRAVRAYAHQMLLAMSLLRKLNIMHADIKPDNILVNESKTVLKICDLGSASDVSENDITPYLVSRFYRAPEIILGLPYDMAIDMWSIGCTLYELYTGKILFPGRSNNQMLLLMMELKGRFNSKMIKKAQFGSAYFDEMGGFESIEQDKVTGADISRKVHISKPTRDLRSRLMPSSVKLKEDEMKLLSSFVDLLDKCLTLDPTRRITPKEALLHPFVRG